MLGNTLFARSKIHLHFPVNFSTQGAARSHLVSKTSVSQTAIYRHLRITITIWRHGTAGWTTAGHGASEPEITISGSKWVLSALSRRQELLPKAGRTLINGWQSIFCLTVRTRQTSDTTLKEEEPRWEWTKVFVFKDFVWLRRRVSETLGCLSTWSWQR